MSFGRESQKESRCFPGHMGASHGKPLAWMVFRGFNGAPIAWGDLLKQQNSVLGPVAGQTRESHQVGELGATCWLKSSCFSELNPPNVEHLVAEGSLQHPMNFGRTLLVFSCSIPLSNLQYSPSIPPPVLHRSIPPYSPVVFP